MSPANEEHLLHWDARTTYMLLLDLFELLNKL